MGWAMLFMHDCDACGFSHERVFTDSWTGLELCLECLCEVAPRTTMSPASEGDNLKKELRVLVDGPLYVES